MSLLHIFSTRLHQIAGRAAVAALIVLFLSITLLGYADNWYADQLLLEQQAISRDEIRVRGEALTAVITAHLSRLQALLGFIPTTEPGGALWSDFEGYAAGIYLEEQGMRSLAIAPGGTVQYLFPPQSDHVLLGQNLLEHPDPEVRASAQRALATDEAMLAGPLALPDGSLVLIGTRAVRQDGAYWGLVQVTFDLQAIFADRTLHPPSDTLELALRDARGRVFLGAYTLFARNPATVEIPVAGERWTLAGIPAGGWNAAIGNQLRLARVAGVLIALLFSVVVYLTVDRQGRLAAAVAQRTRDLAEAGQLLEQRVEERTRELATLLDVSRNVASTLDFPSLLSLLLEQTQEVVDFSGLAVYLVGDEEQLQLGQIYGQRRVGGLLRASIPGDLLDLRAPLIIPDAAVPSPEVERWRILLGTPSAAGTLHHGSWMVVPLLLKNRLLGLMLFEHHLDHSYTPRHGRLALAMANHVAVAIENARLYEQAHSLAALKERQKLARELHDSVSQALYGIGLGAHTALALMEQPVTDEQTRELRESLAYTLSLARAAQVEMRALIFELRPETLEVEGLLAALTRAAEALAARYEIEVVAAFTAEPEVPLATKEVLYRVAQEALHNVAKHAQATRVDLSLKEQEGEIILEVRDNGIGFDPQGDFPGHLGLHSMRERVEGAGGHLTVYSVFGDGSTILVRIPGRHNKPSSVLSH